MFLSGGSICEASSHFYFQVEDLTSVFENVFKYDVTKVELGTSKTQLQLEAAISTWAYEHDGRENLLIVYYAGHAIYDRSSKVLEFSPYVSLLGTPSVRFLE